MHRHSTNSAHDISETSMDPRSSAGRRTPGGGLDGSSADPAGPTRFPLVVFSGNTFQGFIRRLWSLLTSWGYRTVQSRSTRPLGLEQMEPRVLFSVSGYAASLDDAHGAIESQAAIDAHGFIDDAPTAIALNNLTGSDDEGVQIEWPETDGFLGSLFGSRPTLKVSDATVEEGDQNETTDLVFQLTLSQELDRPLTVSYVTISAARGSTYAEPETDFQAVSGTVVFDPGITTVSVSVPVTGDNVAEADETLQLVVLPGDLSAVVVAKAWGTGTVVNDDGQFTAGDLKITDQDDKHVRAHYFGAVQEGATSHLTLTLTNEGDADLTITRAELWDTNNSVEPFSLNRQVDDDNPLIIRPNDSEELVVSFTPTVGQFDFGGLVIESDNPYQPTQRIALTGVGTEEALWLPYEPNAEQVTLQVRQSLVNDPAQARRGEDQGQDETDSYFAGVFVSLPDLGYRVVDWGEPVLQEDGTTLVVEAQFEQAQFGDFPPIPRPAFHLYDLGALGNPEQPTEMSFVFNVNGQELARDTFTVGGAEADIDVLTEEGEQAPRNIAFEGVAEGDTLSKTLTIFNDGDLPLVVKMSEISSPAFDVQLKSGLGLLVPGTATIPPGRSRELVITFSPERGGLHAGGLVLMSNDPDEPVYPISFTGQVDGWVAAIATPWQTDLEVLEDEGSYSVKVTLRMPNDGYRIGEGGWGELEVKETEAGRPAVFQANVDLERFTGESRDEITEFTHIYDLGELKHQQGISTFALSSSNIPADLKIFPVGNAPQAGHDTARTDGVTSITGNVLSNDEDADGDTLIVGAVNGNAEHVGSQISLASGALLRLQADGSFHYDPNGAFDGLNPGQSDTDHFTYTVSDGNGGTDTATVTIIARVDGWVAAIATPWQTDLEVLEDEGSYSVKVTLRMPNDGYRIGEGGWGELEVKETEAGRPAVFQANVDLERFTGESRDEITEFTHIYDLGELKHQQGISTFALSSSNIPADLKIFRVGNAPDRDRPTLVKFKERLLAAPAIRVDSPEQSQPHSPEILTGFEQEVPRPELGPSSEDVGGVDGRTDGFSLGGIRSRINADVTASQAAGVATGVSHPLARLFGRRR